jgi:DNA-binding NtrC family response regulator
LEFAVAASLGDEISLASLPPWFGEQAVAVETPIMSAAEHAFQLSHAESMRRFEREFLARNLRRYRGRINHTARQIGMNKATLLRRMKAYGLTADGVFSSFSGNSIPG